MRRNMLSGRMEFRPTFQPGLWESIGCCHLSPFRWLVNCLNGNKWIKWIKSYLIVINCNKWKFATHLLPIYY